MSIEMDQAADAILQAAGVDQSGDELSDVDVEADGSSSLSDIEDKDAEQDEDVEGSDDLSNVSDEENDSEAETERLEESPNKSRPHQDVLLSSRNGNQTYDRSPSKLQNQVEPQDQEDDEDDDPLSSDDSSVNKSPESPSRSPHDEPEAEPTTAATSLEDSSGEGKKTLSVMDADTRKRKRSIMAGSGMDEDLEEPLRKRTGSIMTQGDDYAMGDDDVNVDEENDTSNPISGNMSGDEGGEQLEEDVIEEAQEPPAEENVQEIDDIVVLPKKRGRKKKRVVENGVNHDEDPELGRDGEAILNDNEDGKNGEEENAENEGDDETEAALKNGEERELGRGSYAL